MGYARAAIKLTKAKLPTEMKRINKCRDCGAHMQKIYDFKANIYFWSCTNEKCREIRYDKNISFEARFNTAAEL